MFNDFLRYNLKKCNVNTETWDAVTKDRCSRRASIHKGTRQFGTDHISQVMDKCQQRKDYLLHCTTYQTLWQQLCMHVKHVTAYFEHNLDSSVIGEFITDDELLSSLSPMDNQDRKRHIHILVNLTMLGLSSQGKFQLRMKLSRVHFLLSKQIFFFFFFNCHIKDFFKL